MIQHVIKSVWHDELWERNAGMNVPSFRQFYLSDNSTVLLLHTCGTAANTICLGLAAKRAARDKRRRMRGGKVEGGKHRRWLISFSPHIRLLAHHPSCSAWAITLFPLDSRKIVICARWKWVASVWYSVGGSKKRAKHALAIASPYQYLVNLVTSSTSVWKIQWRVSGKESSQRKNRSVMCTLLLEKHR
jgi:hypothetical protein